MDEILSKLGAYVSSKDSRLACAAAVILCELAPRNSAVVKELIAGLEQGDPVRRPFVIEALGRIGTVEAAAALVPLIKSEGPASEQALRAIAHTASAALKPLLQMVGHVTPALLERIAECVSRTGEAVAFSTLLSHLQNADVDICRAIRTGMRNAMSTFDDKSKEHLRKQLEKAFNDDALAAHQPSLIALLKIAGDLGDISLQKHLLERIDRNNPVNVRRSALQAVAMLHLSGDQRARIAPRLLPLMQDSDVANIAEPALEAVRQAHLAGEHQGQLRKLLNSPSSRIREFAMQALAAQGSSRTLQELIDCMDSPDRSIREEALAALSRAPSATPALCERLITKPGSEAAQETAKALIPQAATIPHRAMRDLAEYYVQLATGNHRTKAEVEASRGADEKKRAILSVFRAANSSELVESVFENAAKLRQKDDAQKAYELLRGVNGLNGWSDEHRIEMALAGLSFGPKDLTRAVRNSDLNLHALQEVLFSARKSAKELSRILLKDGSLNKKALYYIGFHFVERMQAEREFGKLLLEHLGEGRSDEGKLAREKLIIEGLAAFKGGKTGILEERAKVLMTASDMVAAEKAREERKTSRQNRNGKATAKAVKRKAPAAKKPARRNGKRPVGRK